MNGKFASTWLVFISLIAITWWIEGVQAQSYDPKSTVQKFASVLQIINFAYVDSVNEPEVVEKAIIAALKELDPHSQYISKTELKQTNEPLEGIFEGIGISFQIYKDTILVISPVRGGPAEKLGVMAGDKIVEINGESATGAHVDNNYVFQKLRGDKGTYVEIGVNRSGKRKPINFVIERDRIPINSIDASFLATPEIGYIKLNRFSRTTMDEFREALNELKEKGLKNLIVDLRGNSGGYLDVAVDLADEFLGAGKTILFTEGKSSPKRKYKSSFRGNFITGKLVILIDEGSASASEIVAGAIQDCDRGLIVGRRSFGKGLVQRPYYLPDSSVIRLTIARYYTPTGRCIQKPYNDGFDDYNDDLFRRLQAGELTDGFSKSIPDSLKYFTPNNRVVFGGGGIMPDIFVPWDSTNYTDFYIDLLSRGAFNDYVFDYLDNERGGLARKYPTFELFNSQFQIDSQFLEDFIAFAEGKGIVPVGNEFSCSEELIRYQLKALIARNLFEFKSYFQVLTSFDDGFQKAIEVLMNEHLFVSLEKN
jgi:carboxyl-terminal processing protease